MISLFPCCLLENYEIGEKFSLFLYSKTFGRSIKEKKNIKFMIFLLENQKLLGTCAWVPEKFDAWLNCKVFLEFKQC